MAAIDPQQNQSGSSGLDSNGNFNIEDKARELFVKACKEVHGHICEGLQIEEFNIRRSPKGRFLCKAPNVKIDIQPSDVPGEVSSYLLRYEQVDQDMKVLERLRTDDEFNRYFTDLNVGGKLIKRLTFVAKEGPIVFN